MLRCAPKQIPLQTGLFTQVKCVKMTHPAEGKISEKTGQTCFLHCLIVDADVHLVGAQGVGQGEGVDAHRL